MEFAKKSPLRTTLESRTGATIAAAIAAVIAAILVFAAIHAARNDSTAGSGPVSVLVANQLIPKGSAGQTVAEQHYVRVARVGEGALVSGAVTDVSQIRDKVASQDIYPGQQVSVNAFGGTASGLGDKLSADQRAVALPLDSARGMIGDVETGDRVDVIAGFNVQSASGGTRPVMKPIATDILVLKAATKASGTDPSGNVTLRASAQEATELAFAADNGKLWIVLRPAAGAREVKPSLVSANSVLFGVKPLHVEGGQ
jgi:Flp pilus assembly protein CpaB